MNILKSHKLLFIFSILLLFANFTGHTLSTLSLEKFHDAEFPSERFALSRLIYNIDNGPESQGGFMLRYPAMDALFDDRSKEAWAAFKASDKGAPAMYLSHAGLQDNVIWPLWQGLEWIKGQVLEHAREGSRWQKRLQTMDYYYYYLVTRAVMALLSALMLALFIGWAGRFAGVSGGWLTLGGVVVFLPVFGFFATSVWWSMWLWFVPLLTTLLLFEKHRTGFCFWRASIVSAIVIGVAVGARSMMGFEFLSTIMMGALVPLGFYAFTQGWGIKKWFFCNLIIGLGALAGVAGGFYFYWQALSDFGLDAAEVIRERLEMRSYGGDEVINNNMIAESVEASIWGVIGSYLVSTKELMPPQILLMAPFGWIMWERRKAFSDIDKAFLAAIALSFIGAVSMLVILKGHAFVHGFDIVIWSVSLNLFLMVFYAREISLSSRT